MLFTEILKENKEFSRAYRTGRFVSCNILTCYFKQNKLPFNRMGITVGKKLGNAVTRNRAKRMIRAAYRLNERDFPIGYDLVFVARNDIALRKTGEIENFFRERLIVQMNKAACEKPKSNDKRKPVK